MPVETTAAKHIELEPFQAKFFASKARFPCFAAAWATGKTMTGLLKGLLLSCAYRGNLGLVVRKTFADLRDSTMRDFERYTGMTISSSDKEVELPNTSQIIFRHGDDLGGLQNINLGWFLIEQAEEFDTSDEFNLLRGRLRRQLQFDSTFSEASCAEFPELYRYMRDSDLRQGMLIANKAGHNWIWHDWCETPQSAEFELHEAKTSDNAVNLPSDYLADLESMKNGTETARRKWRIYVDNSWDELDLEAAYYAALMADARREGRIGRYPPDPNVATHTVWDLGASQGGSDTTAIWWFQKIGREIRHIHCYEASTAGVEHYVRYVEEVRRRLKLVYGKHFWPHDGKKLILATGTELYKTAGEMGLKVTFVPKDDRNNGGRTAGIERVRKMLPDATFDEHECRRGIEALEHYQRRKNAQMSTEYKTQFMDTPLHDWASHFADSERYVSGALRKLGSGMTKERVRELMETYT